MINLYDRYTQWSRDLQMSFKLAKLPTPAVVIHDDGFLPTFIDSPVQYFLKLAGSNFSGKPRYFNEVEVPHFWEIKGNARFGEIYDHENLKAKIEFAQPGDNSRLVKTVKWLGPNGKVRVIDQYNQWGWKFAQTTCNQNSRPIFTSYFTDQQQEVLVENHVTGAVSVNFPSGQVEIFANWNKLTAYYLEHANYDLDQVNFNSLGAPFFVVNFLGKRVKLRRLFWQENVPEGIPGNMRSLIANPYGPYEIMVQNKNVYQTLTKMDPKANFHYLGFAYPFARLNRGRAHALILTNSDQIEHLEELVAALPEMKFAVGAITEMSDKLLRLDRYENVRLYPDIQDQELLKLVDWADYYLDINHYNEILDAVRIAFIQNMLILTFDSTIHNKRFVAEENCYSNNNYQKMISDLQSMISNADELEARLQAQWRAADRVLPESYRQFLKK